MKKKEFLLVFLLVFLTNVVSAQNPTRQNQADSAKKAGNYKLALFYRLKEYNQHKYPNDAYNVGNDYALLDMADSAYYYFLLFASSRNGELAESWIYGNPQLNKLRSHPGWPDFDKKLTDLYLQRNPCKDTVYALELRDLYSTDQGPRMNTGRIIRSQGKEVNNETYNEFYKNLVAPDSLNALKLIALLDKKGWPTISGAGENGSYTAFLIIQHATTELRQKYLPVIKALAEKKEASWEYYVMMYDRILVSQSKKQYYGTQYKNDEKTGEALLLPIEDKENVDKRREALGLHPVLKTYVNELGGYVYPSKIAEE